MNIVPIPRWYRKHRLFLTSVHLLSGLMLVTVTGCLQMEHDLRIKPDGSAVYQLQYGISEQAITQFRALRKLRSDLAAMEDEPDNNALHPVLLTFLNPSIPAIREHLQAWEPYGITLRSLRESPRALWRSFSLTLDIQDISRLPDIPFFRTYGFSLQQSSEGSYVLTRPALVDDPAELPPRFSDAELANIRPLLEGFQTEIRIEVPGRILSTTAGNTALQTATWRFDFEHQPQQALHALLRQQFHVAFQAPGLELPALSAAATDVPVRAGR